jgi:hypothetical protein
MTVTVRDNWRLLSLQQPRTFPTEADTAVVLAIASRRHAVNLLWLQVGPVKHTRPSPFRI